ncbi:hypothetical protein BHM03_00016885, partial [Ensete ventricosum]
VGMTSSDSSSSVKVVSPPGSGETSRCDPEVGSSGASFGPPSPVDARVLKDLEVMKSDHDLDTAVTEGSLAMIREPRSNMGCMFRSPGSAPIVWTLPACASRWMLWRLSRYLYVSGPIWGFRLDWSTHPISNASPYLSEEETVLVDRLKGILSSSRAIKEMTELWLVEASLNPASRGTIILLYFSLSNCSLTCRRHKKVKVLTRRHKSHPGEGESRSRSKGKEPATPSEAPAGSEEGGASPGHERPRSMKDLFRIKVHKGDAGYYALLMSDLGHQDPEKEMKAIWKGLKNSTKVWNNSSAAEEFERGLLHPQLARELYILPSEVLMARAAKEMVLGRLITFMDYRIKQLQEELDALKSKGGLEAVAEAEEHASELQEELQKTKRERGEELLRREASENELHKVRSHLGDAQWLLKEARVRSRKMDDEPLQAVKDLESA